MVSAFEKAQLDADIFFVDDAAAMTPAYRHMLSADVFPAFFFRAIADAAARRVRRDVDCCRHMMS